MRIVTFSNIGTIVFYIIIALCSTFLMYRAESKTNKLRQRWAIIATICVITIPQMLRYNVGVDNLPFFLRYTSLISHGSLEYVIARNYEEVSAAIIFWFSNKLFGSVQGAFAFYSLFTQIFMVLAFWNFRKYVRPSACMFVYMSAYYWRTNNMFRQALALAIVLFALRFLWEHKRIKFIAAVLIASIIHTTAIVSLVLLVYYTPNKAKKKSTQFLLYYILPAFVALFIGKILDVLSGISIMSQYSNYFNFEFLGLEWGDLIAIPKLALYILYVANKRRKIEDSADTEANYVYAIFDRAMYCDFLFLVLEMFISHTARIGLYFSIPWLCGFAQVFGMNHFSAKKMSIYRAGVLVYCFLMFFAIMNSNGQAIIPYSFIY